LAVTLWNHPALFEFFESEIRGRSMLRTVFRHLDEDLMSVRAPDRLQAFGGQMEKTDLLEPHHPMLAPFQYWMYGPWLVTAAFVAAVVARRNTWPRRVAYASCWAAAGVLLSIAATWPRWLAEYHWAKADGYEAANQFQAADNELQLALDAMPDLEATRRYWLSKGRLGFRQHETGEHVSFFIAYQYLNSTKDLERARSEIEPFVAKTGGATPQRDLLGEIIGYVAISYISNGNPAASELAWGQAVEVASWKPTYWVAEAATILATAPHRAPEVEERFLPRLVGRGGKGDVGDCFVGADLASALGDAYFVTGDFNRARDMYTLAMDIFHLPKYVNLHAQEGKLGM
jgi:tetratricopeptide (TPR) repeat protein